MFVGERRVIVLVRESDGYTAEQEDPFLVLGHGDTACDALHHLAELISEVTDDD